eukprot:3220398-Ditylum_brightwellii.AAC.1
MQTTRVPAMPDARANKSQKSEHKVPHMPNQNNNKQCKKEETKEESNSIQSKHALCKGVLS